MNTINGTAVNVPSNDMSTLKIGMLFVVLLSIIMAMGLTTIYTEVVKQPPVTVTEQVKQEALDIWKESVEHLAQARIKLVTAEYEREMAVMRGAGEVGKGEMMKMLLELEGKAKAQLMYIEQLEKTIQKLEQ